MMPCLSASRGYRPSSSPSASPFPSPTSATTCSSFCCVISDTKSTSISSSGSEMSSSLFVSRKKARTRRKRPQQMYNEAAAALSAIYPNIFCCGPHHKKIDSKVWKNIEPLRFKDVGATEFLLQEVPTLIGSGRVREVEESGLLCNEGTPPELKCGVGIGHKQLLANDSDDAKSKVEGESSSSLDESVSGCNEYDCFLESNIDGGIMSSIMGSHTNAETAGGLGVFGVVEQGTEYSLHSSAIRALRRTSDSMLFPVFDYSFPRLKLSDKIMAEKERNTMFFSSFEWLNAKERLKLKLNYEDVLNTWSDRGPLYTDKVQPPQIVPDDSFSDPMVQFHSGGILREDDVLQGRANRIATSMNFYVVPDVGFWRTKGNDYVADSSSSVLKDGMTNGSGVREASVLRYKEKRGTRLFSKKIRYEVRKFNAERRPRMKGRFIQSFN